MLQQEIKVTVLLVGKDLSGCLSPWFLHLEQQDYPLGQLEWLIVEVNPSAGTREMVLSLSRGSPLLVRYIPHHEDVAIKAWDLGFREAKGKWILCSQPEVLPARNWIQRHVQMQEIYNGKACVAGLLLLHPRLPMRSITPWLLPEDSPPPIGEDKKPTPFHFSLFNMSVPRELVLRGGTFNKSFSFPEFAEVELVKRLSYANCHLCMDEQAVCWLWKGYSYPDMCQYHYRRGYSIGCYLRLFPEDYPITIQYKLYPPLVTRMINAFLVPYYHRLCLKLHEDSRAFQRMYRRVFRYWRYRGFLDAMAKREPQIDIIYA